MSFLETHKDIHVKVTKVAHRHLRGLLFSKELSMQEFFEEVVQLLVADDRIMTNIVDRLVKKKAQAKLDKLDKKHHQISELDRDALYSLLEDQSPITEEKEEDEI